MEDKQNKKPGNGDENGVLICALCGSGNIETSEQDHTFPYGVGKEKVELCAQVPVRTCSDCGFSFRDHVADAICHDAVCRHLEVMTPDQIRGLREFYRLTQTEFSKITGLGEATVSRWERGSVIQNKAYDNYLYLLRFPETLQRIQKRQTLYVLPESVGPENPEPTFRIIKITEELRKRQERFELQPSLTVAGP